jgi:hypothetical protein
MIFVFTAVATRLGTWSSWYARPKRKTSTRRHAGHASGAVVGAPEQQFSQSNLGTKSFLLTISDDRTKSVRFVNHEVRKMTKVLILYYSAYGHMEEPRTIHKGAEEVAPCGSSRDRR